MNLSTPISMKIDYITDKVGSNKRRGDLVAPAFIRGPAFNRENTVSTVPQEKKKIGWYEELRKILYWSTEFNYPTNLQ